MKDEARAKTPQPPAQGKPGDRFVELMFSGMSHPNVSVQRPHHVSPEHYQALQQVKPTTEGRFRLPHQAPAPEVSVDSPAIDVMTDLTKVGAITIGALASIDEANRTMIERGVRALFVVDEKRALMGIITSSDIVSEKPVQFTHQRGIRHDEVMVRDIMTPADRLEAMEFEDVLKARVGDVIATLKLSGRQHALAIEHGPAAVGARSIRGMFSLTQIARQLGLPPQAVHDIRRTFVEIEAAMGG